MKDKATKEFQEIQQAFSHISAHGRAMGSHTATDPRSPLCKVPNIEPAEEKEWNVGYSLTVRFGSSSGYVQ